MAKSSVFSGVLWASVQRFGNLIISFIANMVLARLLTPDDFGTIGILMFFIAISNTLVDSGFGAALIQKKEVTQNDKSTVFLVNLLMSSAIYTILFLLAPYIADFYHISLLCSLLRVLALVVFFNALMMIQTTIMMKNMNFKTLSICNLSGTIIMAISGILAALAGLGVWSLVIRTLCCGFVTMSLAWIISKWRPSIIFDKNSFKELFGFGGFMLLSSVLLNISNNIQSLILGRLFKPSTVGNFTQARQLRNIPSDSISGVIAQVLFPDFANHQNDNVIIKKKLEQSIDILSFVIAPLMIFCILSAPSLIHLFYGHQWDEAIPYFQILCVGGIPVCLQDVNINVIKAKGKSKMLFLCNFAKVIFYLVIMITFAVFFGIYGFLWSMVLYTAISYIVFASLSSYYIGSSVWRQLLLVFKNVLIAIIPFMLAWCLYYYLRWNEVLLLFLSATFFFSSYLGFSFLVKSKAFFYIVKKIRKDKK